jgi:hypothetical protein
MINSTPPKDPEGMVNLHPDLVMTKTELSSILQKCLDKTMSWLYGHKFSYVKKTDKEGKELCDKSIAELDENLRKQWPRKGRLEVEVF